MSKYMPIGSIIAYAGPITNPFEYDKVFTKGWMLCNGLPFLKDGPDTKPLFDVIQGMWGNTKYNSQEYFHVPDLRGEFLRGIPISTDEPANTLKYAKYKGGSTTGIGSYQKEDSFVTTWKDGVANDKTVGHGQQKVSYELMGGKEPRPTNAFVNYLIKWWEYDVKEDDRYPETIEKFLEKYSIKEWYNKMLPL